jgi:4-hydroxy-2-oxoheptanedioate aldolase
MVIIHHPAVIEILGLAGFDYACIDGEHAPLDRQTLEDLVRAAEIAGITSIFRSALHHPDEILPLLDTGVEGIMVPHVNTADHARMVVDAVKYAPQGKRGMTPGRASRYATVNGREYTKALNRETLVMVQIEEAEAVRNLPEIVKVDGIDIFTIGPGDLAHSLGYEGGEHPEVVKAINYIIDTVVAAGKHTGTATSLSAVPDYVARGAREFAWGDGRLLYESARRIIENVTKT